MYRTSFSHMGPSCICSFESLFKCTYEVYHAKEPLSSGFLKLSEIFYVLWGLKKFRVRRTAVEATLVGLCCEFSGIPYTFTGQGRATFRNHKKHFVHPETAVLTKSFIAQNRKSQSVPELWRFLFFGRIAGAEWTWNILLHPPKIFQSGRRVQEFYLIPPKIYGTMFQRSIF